MSSWTNTFYYYLGCNVVEAEPLEATIKQRHLVMTQLKLSNIRLKPIDRIDVFEVPTKKQGGKKKKR